MTSLDTLVVTYIDGILGGSIAATYHYSSYVLVAPNLSSVAYLFIHTNEIFTMNTRIT